MMRTIKQSAAFLGTSYDALRRRVWSGEIPAVRVGVQYFIRDEALYPLQAEYERSIGRRVVPGGARELTGIAKRRKQRRNRSLGHKFGWKIRKDLERRGMKLGGKNFSR